MIKQLFIENHPVKVFINNSQRQFYIEPLIINSHEYLEKYSNNDLNHYTHKAISNGIKIKKRGK